MKQCQVSPGVWVRNPRPGVWWSDPRQISRDQKVPLIAALGRCRSALLGSEACYECARAIAETFKADARRLFLNGWDLPTPDGVFGNYIRANGSPLFLTWLTDIGMLFNVVVGLFNRDPDDTGPDLNMVVLMLQAQDVYDTWLSRLSRWLYNRLAAVSNGTTQMGEPNVVLGRLLWYYRPATGNNIEVAQAFAERVRQTFPRGS
jgi:hypothetical protein